MRRFFLPIFLRPFPVFLVPTIKPPLYAERYPVIVPEFSGTANGGGRKYLKSRCVKVLWKSARWRDAQEPALRSRLILLIRKAGTHYPKKLEIHHETGTQMDHIVSLIEHREVPVAVRKERRRPLLIQPKMQARTNLEETVAEFRSANIKYLAAARE